MRRIGRFVGRGLLQVEPPLLEKILVLEVERLVPDLVLGSRCLRVARDLVLLVGEGSFCPMGGLTSLSTLFHHHVSTCNVPW